MNSRRIFPSLLIGLSILVPVAAVATPTNSPWQQTSQTGLTPEQQQARERFREALRLARAGDIAAAKSTALEGARLDPANADGLNLLGELHEMLDELDSASEAYRQAQVADPEWAPPFENQGTLYLRQERYALALVPLERAAQLEPDKPLLHAYLGIALRATNRPQEAAQAFGRAWELEPDNVNLAVDVAASRNLAGDLAGAVAAAERAIEIDPSNVPARTMLAQLLSSTLDPDYLVQAPAAFRDLIALEPERPAPWSALARVYTTLALHQEAEAAIQHAIDLGLNTPEAWYRLGQTQAKQKRFAAAVETFNKVLELDPDAGWAYYSRGEAYYILNRPDDALADLLEAIERLPGEPEPLLSTVNIYRVKGDLEAAEGYLDAARATGKSRTEVDLATGRLHLRQGRNEEAIEVLARVLQQDPTLIEAQYLSGQALVKSGRVEEGRAALADYQLKLNAQRQESVDDLRLEVRGRGRIYILRARVFMHEGRYETALEQLQGAADLAPDNPEVWQLLIQVHEALGNAEGAQQARDRLQALQQLTGLRQLPRETDGYCRP